MSNKIKVLIADDHPVVRQGLEIMLATQDDMELIGEAVDGEEAVALARELKPDVMVLDLKMPQKDGLEVVSEVNREPGHPRVIVLAGQAEDEQVRAALRAGALGFLLKDAAADQLVEAIRAVYQGSNVLQSATVRKLMLEGTRMDDSLAAVDPLTPRELDVLRLLARGMSNDQIAGKLVLTRHTVMTHVRNILHKLQLANRTQAAIYARDRGLA
jgi:DNA-binding NarL/FixJ family response regulator